MNKKSNSAWLTSELPAAVRISYVFRNFFIIIPPPPQTVFGGGGVYCFGVVHPSFCPQHMKILNEIHETW